MKKFILTFGLIISIHLSMKSQIEFGFKNAHIEGLAGLSTSFSTFHIIPFIGAGIYPFSVKTFGEQKNQLGLEAFLYVRSLNTYTPYVLVDGRFGISKKIAVDIDAGFGLTIAPAGTIFKGCSDLAVLYRINNKIGIRPYTGIHLYANPSYAPSNPYSKSLLYDFFGGIGVVYSIK